MFTFFYRSFSTQAAQQITKKIAPNLKLPKTNVSPLTSKLAQLHGQFIASNPDTKLNADKVDFIKQAISLRARHG